MPLIKSLARMWISICLMLATGGFFLYSDMHPHTVSLMSKYGVLCINVLWLTYIVSAGVRERTKANNFKGGVR